MKNDYFEVAALAEECRIDLIAFSTRDDGRILDLTMQGRKKRIHQLLRQIGGRPARVEFFLGRWTATVAAQ